MQFRFAGHPLSHWFRACGACGASFGPTDFFCKPCWGEFLSRINQGARLRQRGDDVATYALWTWTKRNDVFLRPLIYALKGGWLGGPFLRLAEELSDARATLPLRPKPFCVTIPPRKAGRERDHAWRLASAFARLWAVELWDGLGDGLGDGREPGFQSQKLKTASDRRKLSFSRRLPLPDDAADRAWVFIDDVVTTGATAKAAFEALGRPVRFEAWALAYRPPPTEMDEFDAIC